MKKISSLYIHFPFCQHLCNYCDFYKHKLDEVNQVIEFEELITKQWSKHLGLLDSEKLELIELETLYLGGGTPSLWKKRGPVFLENFFQKNNIKLSKNIEFTLEVDPGTWTPDEIESWQKVGVNRFSIGSQAYDEKFLKIMDRKHSLQDVRYSLDYFSRRELNFSVDLMIGLPFENERDIKAELEELMIYKPSHLSVYILKARKNYPLKTELIQDDKVADNYILVSDFLKSEGYNHYEVSNFSKTNRESRHNLKYWSYDTVLGLGPNATGLIVRDDSAMRYQWKSQSVGYTSEEITGSSLLIEKLYMNLRNSSGLRPSEIFSGKDLDVVARLYTKWGELNYLSLGSSLNNIQLNSNGFLMCDSILDDLFVNTAL